MSIYKNWYGWTYSPGVCLSSGALENRTLLEDMLIPYWSIYSRVARRRAENERKQIPNSELLSFTEDIACHANV